MKICASCRTDIGEEIIGTVCPVCKVSFIRCRPIDKNEPNNNHSSALVSVDDKQPITEINCENCGAKIPGGHNSCPYCPGVVPSRFKVKWPWGEYMTIENGLFVGRVPPVAKDLAERLEKNYLDVSRMHAELEKRAEGCFIRDLSSTNGTYVNDNRLSAFEWWAIKPGDRIRFGNDLDIVIEYDRDIERI